MRVVRSMSTAATAVLLVASTVLPMAARADTPLAAGGSAGVGPVEVSSAVRSDVSPPLRTMTPTAPSAATLRERPLRRISPGGGSGQPDGALQTAPGPAVGTTSGLGFAGVGQGDYGFSDQYAPPDTNGAIGASQYVQWVNVSFAVFNKGTGALVFGPAAGNTLWTGFGGGCETNNDGDPIVQYDKAANRWIMTQFSVSTKPYLQCVAVSTTSDATGTYNRYAFSYGSTQFPDYPKLGVWPDGYYISYNIFNNGTTFGGAKVCAFDRSAMLTGAAATQECFQLSTSYGGLLPSDLDGSILPPAGSPNFFLNFGSNSLNLWKFHADFATPANATLGGPTNIAVAAFTTACNGGGTCVPQPGTNQKLDSLGDRLMYRLAYRHFADGHEALVVNHSVSVSGTTSVRWYELRNPTGSTIAAGTPGVFQQGTLNAADGIHRWMGSTSMDQQGNMALGYSASNSSVYPSVRYTGRLAGDALGTMEVETVVQAGAGSQLPNLSRWGDYSAMTVDPVDDCTFWYTNEYLKTSGTFNWSTWITSFRFPGCGSTVTTGTISGSVTDSFSHAGISGATVAITGGTSTATDGSGNYTLSNVAAGTYALTASATGYTSASASTSVTAGSTTTQNFALVPSSSTATVPGQPAAPTAKAGSGKGITVSWTAPTDGGSPITGYTLSRYVACDLTTNPVRIIPGNVLSYKDTSTIKKTSYCYTVAATNAIGTGPASSASPTVTALR